MNETEGPTIIGGGGDVDDYEDNHQHEHTHIFYIKI